MGIFGAMRTSMSQAPPPAPVPPAARTPTPVPPVALAEASAPAPPAPSHRTWNAPTRVPGATIHSPSTPVGATDSASEAANARA